MNRINLLFEGKPIATGTKVHGIAVHSGKTEHKKDKETQFNDTRVYLQEYLKAAAPTLVGKPILLDHDPKKVLGRITVARWDETANGIYYEGTITADVAPRIDSGEITAVSVGLNPWIEGGGVLWKDGFAPINYVFEELSLIDPKIMDPGDPQAWVKLEEAIAKDKGDFIAQLERQVPDRLLKNPPIQEAETEPPTPEATEETVKSETPLERFARRLKK